MVRNSECNSIHCEGIELVGMECTKVTYTTREQKTVDNLLETYEFISYGENSAGMTTPSEALCLMCQIVLQNSPKAARKLSVCQIIDKENANGLIAEFKKILGGQPLVEIAYLETELDNLKEKYDIILLTKSSLPQMNGKNISNYLTQQGFIILAGTPLKQQTETMQTIIKFNTETHTISLLRPIYDFSDKSAIINVSNQNFSWLNELKMYIEQLNYKMIYLVAQNEDTSGVLGLVNCLVSEDTNVNFRAFSLENNSEVFSIDNEFFKKQISRNIVTNVLRKNTWGTYVHKTFNPVQVREVGDAAVNMTAARDFSTLKWIETPLALQR